MSLTWGLIGAGRIAQAYVQAFSTSHSAQLVAIADTRPEAAARLAYQAGCAGYTSYQALCDAAAVDAVLVCTPPASHAEIGCYFLQQSIPVLCEKPLSIDVESTRMMIDTAEDADVCLSVGAKYRYITDITEAKGLIASGLIGNLVGCDIAFMAPTDMTATWHANALISGGGVLMDHGPHAFDLMRYFLGPLDAVYVKEEQRLQGLPVEETVSVRVRNHDGVAGRIRLSWNATSPTDDFVMLRGTKGRLGIGWDTSWYCLADVGETSFYGAGYNKIQALRRQVENMSAAIELRQPLEMTPADALASMEMIQTAYTALVQQTWVDIGEPFMAAAYGAMS